MKYKWAVLVNNNKIIGYVDAESEYYAIKIAKEKLAKNKYFFIERLCSSNLNIRDEIVQ
jgi:hypothetical protein